MNTDRGFTLLLAALVASAVLAIGAAIYRLAVKEVNLSSLGRESQFAFYAADTAAECALYWDFRYGYFDIAAPTDPAAADPKCDGQSLGAGGRTGAYPQTMTFRFEPRAPGGNGRCVDVSVAKTQDALTHVVSTVVHSDGYSSACAAIDTNPRTLQRSVELRY